MAYGMAIHVPESENIFQRPKSPGKSLKFHRGSDCLQVSVPESENILQRPKISRKIPEIP